MSTSFRSALIAAPLAAMALTGCGGNGPDDLPEDIALRQFNNCGQLRDYAEEVILEQLIMSRYSNYGWGWMEDDAGDTQAGADDGPTDYTTTNTQEAGVDEVDIVKTDGQYIYAVDNTELHIVDSWPVADAEKVSSLELGGYVRGIFLHDDTVLAMSYSYDQISERYWGGTRITFIDVSTRSEPVITRTVDIEGWFADGRLIGADAYLVVDTWLPLPQAAWELVWDETLGLPDMDWNASEAEQEEIRDQARQILAPEVHDIVVGLSLDDLLPLYRDQVAGAPDADLEPLNSCSNVYRPADVSQWSMTNVVHIDLDDGDLDATGVLSDGWTVYASQENLYVAQTSWWSWWGWGSNELTTNIHKFELGDGAPDYVAAGEVDGWLLNQWAMSEYDGNLRVATTEIDWWWQSTDQDEGNNVFVLAQDGGELVTIGSVEGFAPGEQITGVRMMGETGYVVTFEWVDPLWVVDLSDPTSPALRGELELPGFSTYLHPLAEDHLIGIGYAGDADGNITGLAINVFDVSDPDAPALAHQLTFESDDWSWSEAVWDHHAITYHRGVLSMPLYTYDYNPLTGYWQGFSGLVVLDVDTSGITELGRIDHAELVEDSECYYEWGCDDYWYAWMRRSVYIEDNLFSISNYGMKVNDLNDPDTQIAQVLFHPQSIID